MEIAGLTTTTTNPKKCLRPSEILKSDKMVDNIVCALETQFINPFHPDLEHDKLYNLASGYPAPENVCESLLQIETTGKERMERFEARLTDSTPAEKFFDPIERVAIKTFKDAVVKTAVRSKGKTKELVFQRNILGLLVAHSDKHKMGINLEKALAFPLAPVAIPLSTADGAIRKTVKSKLYQACMDDLTILRVEEFPSRELLKTYFLDLAAAIRSLVGNINTIRDMAMKILKTIPQQYSKIFIACDTYKEDSINRGERVARGSSERYLLNSPDMKVPYDMPTF